MYKRQVPYIQVPTSLLAQVDSSIGGKVAVDLPEGKNLVGSFYQPRMVFVDPGLLSTLPQRVYADGMGEVVKYGCIGDGELFSLLEQGPEALWGRMEEMCIRDRAIPMRWRSTRPSGAFIAPTSLAWPTAL